jgi:hypothetical protein
MADQHGKSTDRAADATPRGTAQNAGAPQVAVSQAPPQADPARAGESGDPDVQRLLAELQTAQMNRAALTADEDAITAADEAVAVARKPLEDLGYKV